MRNYSNPRDPWHLHDPQKLLVDTARRVRFRAGSSYLALVGLDGKLLGARRLPAKVESLSDRWDIARNYVAPVAERLAGPSQYEAPKKVLHMIRCRDARAVWGIHDLAFAYGLLDGKQMLDCFTGELLIVTPHGWCKGPRTGRATPTLEELAELRPSGRRAVTRSPVRRQGA